MKRSILFFCVIFLSMIDYSQSSETFANLNDAIRDGNRVTNFYQGLTWTVIDARTDQTGNELPILIRDTKLSTSIFGGMCDLTLIAQRESDGVLGDIPTSVSAKVEETISYPYKAETNTISENDFFGTTNLLLEAPRKRERSPMEELIWSKGSVVDYDCEQLGANIGDPCDDGDEFTINDMVTEDCECLGTVAVIENTPELCSDGIDNDGDGVADCDDPNCQAIANNIGCLTCFGDGLSFADVVLEYVQHCPNNTTTNPQNALGLPSYTGLDGGPYQFVSLGGGYIKLGFTNNTLVNSGNSDPDLFVFEVGPLVEPSYIELRPSNAQTEALCIAAGILDTDGDGYYEFGAIGGALASVDIDVFFDNLPPNSVFFDAIKIVDFPGNCEGPWPGADIDAVCALSSVECAVGAPCDDEDPLTENDVFNEDCECEGTLIIFDCPSLNANIGDSCDDGDEFTVDDVITEDCECLGDVVIVENTPELCSDGIDNDGNGVADCDDPNCQAIANNIGCLTCFEDGLSFADVVLEYVQNCPNNIATDPETALGLPNYTSGGGGSSQAVSLGGGYIKLGFTNNTLINSGTPDADLFVFEVGPLVEPSYIELRPSNAQTEALCIAAGILDTDGDGYYEFGAIGGALASVDIDAFFDDLPPRSVFFDAIKIVDFPGNCATDTPGADIDAVCALSSIECVFGEPCDDGNPLTENDMINEDCECEGALIEFDCPSLNANIGDSCDDGDEFTVDDVITEDCECLGTVVIVENTPELCSDGIDNDGNGVADCDDPNCQTIANNIGCLTCFEDGLSFADVVLEYVQNCPNNLYTNPENALGLPNYTGLNDGPNQYVSLGRGYIKLGFTNNTLINSGTPDADLFIFEVGPAVESSYIELRPSNAQTEALCIAAGLLDSDGDGYYEFGAIGGALASVDIDAFFDDLPPSSVFFDAIKIVDFDGNCATDSPGADIDAVCALSSIECVVGEPCDDGNPLTENDMINEDCECVGTPIIIYDCPDLGVNIGDPCDDMDASTENDIITEDCECVGTPIEIGCTNTNSYGSANVSTPGIKTISTCTWFREYSTITGVNTGYEYEFAGAENTSGNLAYITVRSGSYDGPVVDAGWSPLTVTAASDDNLYVHWNADENCGETTNCATTTVTCITCATIEDCEGVPGGSALPGTSCDDGDSATYDDTYTEDCECVGSPYDCIELEANIGDSCDDGDATTVNDTVNEDCECVGEPAAAGSICSNAIPLECNAGPVTYSSANSNGTNTTSCFMGDNGLWFSFVGTGADITVNSSATFDHRLSVNRGSCDDLTSIVCQDSSIYDENYTISASVEGEMYYVYIARYNSGSTTTGDITISIDCAVFPECEAPELALYVSDSVGEPFEGCIEAGGEYYVYATLSGGSGNTSYFVSANDSVAVEVNANGSVVLGPFDAGTNVNVSALGVQDEDCVASATQESPGICEPANDDCEDAIALSCGDSVAGTTIGASYSGMTDNCTFRTNGDVFYTLDIVEGNEYTVSVVGSDYDAVLAIYSGVCHQLTEIACADNGFTEGAAETITFTAAATETVVIRTYDWSTSAGSFIISVECEDDYTIPASDYFVTTWMTTADNEEIIIPTTGVGYDYGIDWGDGATEDGITANATHTYAAAGTYTVKIHGDFPRIFFNNSGDRNKIQSIVQWGDIEWTSMNSAFMGATNLVNDATDTPDLSMVTDMYGMFAYAQSFNGGNIGDWDVSNVTNMYGMFGGAFVFNTDISGWDVDNVTNMKLMFSYAHAFNQDIGNWNVSSVRNMESMFRNATAFNQNLGAWNVINVTNMRFMFKDIALSTDNYDALLMGWSALQNLKTGVTLDAGNSKYCNGAAAKDVLTDSNGPNWTITDGGMDVNCGTPLLGLDDNSSLSGIVLYSNPMENQLILGNPMNIELVSASIYDLTGKLIQTVDLRGMTSEKVLDVSDLSSATYMVMIIGQNGGQVSKLMVKK